MNMKTIVMILLFFSATLAAGCGVTATVSATDVTQPVMLGKKIKIHGTANEQWQLKVPFDIGSSATRPYGFYGHQRSGNKVNPELLKLVETSEDRIVIDEIYTGSYSLLVIFPPAIDEHERSWADIKGGIYQNRAGKECRIM